MSTTGNAESYIELRGEIMIPEAIHGKSAYEIAVANGFNGTEAEWVNFTQTEANRAEAAANRAAQSANDAASKAQEIADAKESGEFDGADGKSSYQYAQEGGYSGTEAEYAEDINPDNIKNVVAQDIIAQLQGLPVFGVVDENKIIKLTTLLPDGKYSMGYDNADGTFTKIVDFTKGSEEPEITNIIDTVGYVDGQRLSTSTGELKPEDGYVTTGEIDLTPHGLNTAVTVRTEGVDFRSSLHSYCAFCGYSNGTLTQANFMEELPVSASFDDEGNVTFQMAYTEKISSFRICGYGNGANLIVTINEEIV